MGEVNFAGLKGNRDEDKAVLAISRLLKGETNDENSRLPIGVGLKISKAEDKIWGYIANSIALRGLEEVSFLHRPSIVTNSI